MANRASNSDTIKKFTEIYRSMTEVDLQEEGDALLDQVFAYLIAIDCHSIQTLYDMSEILEVRIYNIKQDKRDYLN